MNIAMDACSAILLSKATAIEIFSKQHNVLVTNQTYDEVIKGREKKFEDALLIEKLCNEGIIKIISMEDSKLTNKIKHSFGFGDGEASTIAYAIENKLAILTDNKQARKASNIYGLRLLGSPEVIVSLFKGKKIDKDKALYALEKLRKAGWFDGYLIEKAKEEISK